MPDVRKNIHHGTYLNWFVLVMVCCIGSIGVVFSLPTLVGTFELPDLLEHTQEAHLFVAAASLLVLGGLVLQRRDLFRLWHGYVAAQKELADRAEKHAARVYALLNVSKMMVAQNDVGAVFDYVTTTCVDVFNSHQASLMLYKPDEDSLEVKSASGRMVPKGIIGTKQKLGVGVAGWVALRREPLLITPKGRPESYPGLEFKQRDLVTAMVVPIILRDELVGVLNVSSRSPKIIFDSEDLRALQVFAENVGTAIRHTEQAEWMRSTIRKLQGHKERDAVAADPVRSDDADAF